jgi:phospholipase/carboxylesterase
MTADLSFRHIFEPSASTPPPVLLLHGTGGDEHDLLQLGRAIAPGAALLAPRGKILENGMSRFFRRLAEGVFDEDDVRFRAAELAGFIAHARRLYNLQAPIAVGFSNGANIAAAVLLLHPEALAGAILIRAMVPLSVEAGDALTGKPILIISGDSDPIAPPDNAARLAAMLAARGAAVEHETIPASHGMAQRDLLLSASFFDRLRGRASDRRVSPHR